MPIEVFNRVEKKYAITENTYLEIRDFLKKYVVLDKHNVNDATYPICNIYYDTGDNYLIKNSIEKPEYKEKLRLRSYGVPDSDDQIVFLEMKKKYKGITYKRRSRLKLWEAYEFLNNHKFPEKSDYINVQVLNEIDYVIKFYNPIPKMKISYDRYAFFSTESRDLRISFDSNIFINKEHLRLEDPDKGERLLKENYRVMEIKAEKSIPLWLSEYLSKNKIYPTGFSKYGSGYKKYLSETLEGEQCSILQQEPLLAKSLL